MFKTVKELKEFIIWAKAQKLHSVEVEGVKFEISPYAFIDAIHEEPFQTETPVTNNAPHETPTDEELQIMNEDFQSKEDEDILFHSSQP